MAYTNSLKVFERLRPAFDEKQATAVAEAIDEALETNNDILLSDVATKNDLTGIQTQIAETKAEIIKWMFIFWIGQFASIVGVITAILFAFFKK